MDIFKFKKFKIHQNENVHRVGTDGVLLGAWVNIDNTQSILDIGTGTGLIALMLAQRSKANITAIEPDHEAFSVAKLNATDSPWNSRLKIIETTLQDFYAAFDLVVCNPPFFENSLKPPTPQRQNQRHSDTLSQSQLIENTIEKLRPEGRLAVVLPTVEGNRFIEVAKTFNLHLTRSCGVVSKIGKPQERWLLEFSQQPTPLEHSILSIMDASGQWTAEYKSLTAEFYLNF